MPNTRIQTTLVSPGQSVGVVNDVDVLTEAIMSLFRTYIPGLPPLKGIRSFAVGTNDSAPIPCVMVQPVELQASMITSARFNKLYPFDIWYSVGAETVEDVAVLVTDAGALFVKLFSNNALNDRTASPPSNKFKANGTTWVDCEMTHISFSPALLSGRDPGPKYFALGQFQLKIQIVPALA